MIVVHHLENSRSQRVLWLLEELGLAYELKRYERDPKTMLAPAELRAVHPLGKAPVITDGDQVVAETGAIVEYILECYGEGCLQPRDNLTDRTSYRFWLHFAEGSAMPPLVMKLVFARLPDEVPFWIKPVAKLLARGVSERFLDPTLEKQLRFMDTSLEATGWFAGPNLTAADIMMSFPVETGAARSGLDQYEHLTAWLKTIHARPAYQRALARGGPYAYGGSPTVRVKTLHSIDLPLRHVDCRGSRTVTDPARSRRERGHWRPPRP